MGWGWGLITLMLSGFTENQIFRGVHEKQIFRGELPKKGKVGQGGLYPNAHYVH